MTQPRRVLLKLSGEAFGGGSVGLDPTVVRDIAQQIATAVNGGVQVAVVVGGGNFFRDAQLASAGIDREIRLAAFMKCSAYRHADKY